MSAPHQDYALSIAKFGDHVDKSIFAQILEMDDEDDGTREFSSSIVFDFLQQAESTFEHMDKLIEEKDLEALSGQGHFLKGSSATLGFVHIRDACEKIQHFGHMKTEDGNGELTDKEEALRLIEGSVQDAKTAYRTVKKLMQMFFPRDDEHDETSKTT